MTALTQNDYIEVEINQGMIDFANKKHNKIHIDTEKDKRSFGSESERLFTGYLGEAVIVNHFKLQDIDDYDFDVIIDNKKCDIKTISCKFKPLPSYIATVNSWKKDEGNKQDADFYIFLRIANNQTAWILGYMNCDEFHDRSHFVRKGETYEGQKFIKANANILPIKDLYKFK